jgi:electron transfer flavoprotein-quinone oxidoreductase
MEKFDVAIVGGGSAGLAALKQLSNLGKQAVLLESGKAIGSKSISGGILYSKNLNTVRLTMSKMSTDKNLSQRPP